TDHTWPDAQRIAAGGFRDTTRVASGDPRMARDICLTNADPLVACLDAYITRLQAVRDRVAAHDATLEADFRVARRARDAALSSCPPPRGEAREFLGRTPPPGQGEPAVPV